MVSMTRRLVWCSLAIAALACSNSVGPNTTGRWASPGVELRMTPIMGRFTMACYRPVAVSPNVRFDETGTIRFTGNLINSSGSYPFALSGSLVGDTLVTSMSVHYGPSGSSTYTFVMTRDGDAAFDRLNCQP